MSTVELEKVEKPNDNQEPRLWHLVNDPVGATRAICGAELKGIDGGWTEEPDVDTCVVCADLAWGTYQ